MTRFRPMEPNDVDAVASIEATVSPDPWSAELFADEFRGPDNRHWLVAEHDGRLVGFGGSLRITDELHIMNLAVDPAERRRGLASRLLARLLLAGLDRGSVSATLEVRSGNTAAIGLYRRFGFDEAGRRDRYYPDGEDAVIMWRHRLHRPDTQRFLRGWLDDDLGRSPGTQTGGVAS